jgi:quercetin dioxygenase-like cupin family protein
MSCARLTFVAAFYAAVILPRPGPARDVTAAPVQEPSTRVLLENEHVRVIESLYPPGASSPLHAHAWPRVVYVVEGGTLALEDPDGRVTRIEAVAGQAAWRPPEAHVVRNVGQTRVRVVEVEVKSADGA